jgi:hypothetical protein
MNKIPKRCSKSSLFFSVFALHVSGATFTHHQEHKPCERVRCNCINRLCSWAKCVPDPDQLYGNSKKMQQIEFIFLRFCSTCFGRYIHPSSGASTVQAGMV